MTYYNTTHEAGATLDLFAAQAKTQDQKVLAYFSARKGVAISPSQVHSDLGLRCPLTSIRRSITNLTKAGYLEKTDVKVDGAYGRPEYCWTLK